MVTPGSKTADGGRGEVRKPGGKRLLIVLAVSAYVALGVPVWWFTTLIPRPPLPHAAMQRVDAAYNNSMLMLSAGVHVYLVEPDQGLDATWLAHTMQQALARLHVEGNPTVDQVAVIHESEGTCQHASMNHVTSMQSNRRGKQPHHTMQEAQPWAMPCLHLSSWAQTQSAKSTVSVESVESVVPADSVRSWLQQADPAMLDDGLQELLVQHQSSVAGQYILFVLPGQPPEGQRQLVVGQDRHAWMWSEPAAGSSDKVCGSTEECCVQLAAPAVAHMISPQPGVAAVQSAKQLPTSPSGDTILQFTLANGADESKVEVVANLGQAAEPKAGMVGNLGQTVFSTWDFDRFRRLYVQPLVVALSPVLSLHVESQVRLHMSPGVTPRWSAKHQAHILRAKKLPFFVGSDWSLDFGLDAGGEGGEGAGWGTGVEDGTEGGKGAGWEARVEDGTDGGDGAGWGAGEQTSTVPLARAGACPWQGETSAAAGGVASGGVAGWGQCGVAGEGRKADQAHTPAHVLHMVLFVPPAAQQPVRLLGAGGEVSATNSFSIPSWGAVHVLGGAPAGGAVAAGGAAGGAGSGSADGAADVAASEQVGNGDVSGVAGGEAGGAAAADAGGDAVKGSGGESAGTSDGAGTPAGRAERPLDDDQLHAFAETVVGELRVLLGLPERPGVTLVGAAGTGAGTAGTGTGAAGTGTGVAGTGAGVAAAHMEVRMSDVGVSAWEVDALSRARAASDIAQAARVLGSFSRLAQALPNLEMPDQIGAHVATSLAALREAVGAAQAGRHTEAVAAARQAHAAAESAFSHPAVLAQLSFPDSHKVGVYVPFFLPALLPVALALITEARRSTRRWRAYRQAVRERRAAEQGIPLGLSAVELDQLMIMRAKNDARPAGARNDVVHSSQ